MNQLKNHLDLIDLEKRYGETLAVRGINLSLPENTYCCLLGPSGCGKTSLLRMIAGHEDITSGKVFLDNQDISNEPPAARSTSMMFQSYALFPHLKVIDNVAFALKIWGLAKLNVMRAQWSFWKVSSFIRCRNDIQANYQVVSSSAWRWRGH